MNKVDIKIMAVKPRRKIVLSMLDQLGLSEEETVIYDDRPNGGGTLYTCRKCWEAPIPDGVTHRLVLQDDVLLCNDFIEIMNKIVNVHPEFIFTLYCPRLRFEDAVSGSPYIIIKGCNTWGPGNMMPVSYIKSIFDFVDAELGHDFPFDDGIYSWWAQREKVYIASTIPSTIQHLCPTESTLGYNNKSKVTKVWVGNDLSAVDWSAKSFAFSKSMPIAVSLEKVKQQIACGSIRVHTIFSKNGGNEFNAE